MECNQNLAFTSFLEPFLKEITIRLFNDIIRFQCNDKFLLAADAQAQCFNTFYGHNLYIFDEI